MVCKICHKDLRIIYHTKPLARTISYQCDCCESSGLVQQEESGAAFPLNRILSGLLTGNMTNKERKFLSCAKPHDLSINNNLLLFNLQNGDGFQSQQNMRGFLSL